MTGGWFVGFVLFLVVSGALLLLLVGLAEREDEEDRRGR